jgi:hypothetical protein
MVHIPHDAKWYLAEIVQEITVQDDPRNIVWRNLTLVRAGSPDEAYEKALSLGSDGKTQYENPHGKLVHITFRGLSSLNVICDELEHGTELLFHTDVNLSPKQINKILRSKNELEVFLPIQKHDGPDIASRKVLEEVKKQFGIDPP